METEGLNAVRNYLGGSVQYSVKVMMLHLAFRKECVFYNQKPVPKETDHLGEVEVAQAFAIVLLACIHESVARTLLCSSKSCQDGVVSSSHLTRDLKCLQFFCFVFYRQILN